MRNARLVACSVLPTSPTKNHPYHPIHGRQPRAMTESGVLPQSFRGLNGADHPVFNKAVPVELRPGRTCEVLCAFPEPAKTRGDDVIFFIHGAMATMTQFEYQLPHFLDAGFTCIAFDSLGCGASPKPDDFEAYSFENAFEDVCELVRRFKGHRNVLCGHSYGSSMCLRMANLASSDPSSGLPQPDGLVLLGSGIGPDKCPTAASVFFLPVFVLEFIVPLLRKGFKDRALHEETLKEETEVHKRLLARMRAAEGANPMYMVQACVQQMRWVQRDEVGAIRTPALIVTGEGDKITLQEWAQALADALPNGGEVHILPKASHQVMLERPETVNALIDGYLARVMPTLGGGGGA